MKKLYLLAMAVMIGATAVADDLEYVSIGTGQYQDGLLTAMYGLELEPWAIDVQQCTTDENLYRVENPYMAEACPIDYSTLCAYFSDAQASEYWDIDCTDPNLVVWSNLYTGIYTTDDVDATEDGYLVGIYYDATYASYSTCSTFDGSIIKAVPYALYTWFTSSDWAYINATIYLPGQEVETWDYKYQALYTDALWSYYSDTDQQSWVIDVYESSLTPNLFRFDNPYTAETCPIDFGEDVSIAASAEKYWEINATDPTSVDQSNLYFNTGIEIVSGYPVFIFQSSSSSGTLEDNVITFGKNALGAYYIYSSNSYDYLTSSTTFQLDYKAESLDQIELAGQDAAPAYYTIQGIQVNDITAPGLYIKRQGNHSEKILVK